MSFLLWIFIGWFTGWQTGRKMRGFGYGPLIDGVMGVAGGVLGGFIASAQSFSATTDMVLSSLGAMVGAATATALIGYASGRSRFA